MNINYKTYNALKDLIYVELKLCLIKLKVLKLYFKVTLKSSNLY